MLTTPITESDMVIAKTDGSSNWNDLVTNIDVNLNVFSSAGLTSFSDFTGKNPGNPLPVELIAFNTNCDNGEVILNWTTATETNCDYYVIEKSIDALQWSALGRVQGSGNSNHLVHYSYRDKNNDGLAYYRLLQVDYDGQTGVYGPVYSNCEQSTNASVDIYPNPFVDELYIVAKGEGNMQLRLSDEFGKEVAAWNFTLSSNMKDVFTVATSNLAKGIYFAEILIGKEVFRKKLVKG
jgi:hypothetical protein